MSDYPDWFYCKICHGGGLVGFLPSGQGYNSTGQVIGTYHPHNALCISCLGSGFSDNIFKHSRLGMYWKPSSADDFINYNHYVEWCQWYDQKHGLPDRFATQRKVRQLTPEEIKSQEEWDEICEVHRKDFEKRRRTAQFESQRRKRAPQVALMKKMIEDQKKKDEEIKRRNKEIDHLRRFMESAFYKKKFNLWREYVVRDSFLVKLKDLKETQETPLLNPSLYDRRHEKEKDKLIFDKLKQEVIEYYYKSPHYKDFETSAWYFPENLLIERLDEMEKSYLREMEEERKENRKRERREKCCGCILL